ncbi:hypothetical protein GW17_00046469 [Ensete ventricosum]|nr:hypothetical protein GW17_00046469 [Ensete ventricosum]
MGSRDWVGFSQRRFGNQTALVTSPSQRPAMDTSDATASSRQDMFVVNDRPRRGPCAGYSGHLTTKVGDSQSVGCGFIPRSSIFPSAFAEARGGAGRCDATISIRFLPCRETLEIRGSKPELFLGLLFFVLGA